MLKISHSSMSVARGCWKKYYWKYIEGLTPKRRSVALSLGSAVHTCFEKFYTGSSDSEIISYLQETFKEEISNASEYDVEALELAKYTALGMWLYYPYKDVTEFTTNVPEMEFETKIKGLRNVRLVGRVDGLVEKDGKMWIREVKTTGLTPRQFTGRVQTSSQASTYVYALKSLGHPVIGVMYDCIKKPLLRKRKYESVIEFGERIVNDYKEDSKKPENERKAYIREYAYRSTQQLKDYEKDLRALITDIRYKRNHKNWCRNTDQCWNFNSLCPYEKICFVEKPDQLTLELNYDRKVRV